MKRNKMFGVLAAFVMVVGMIAFALPTEKVAASGQDISLSLMPFGEALNANDGPVSVWVEVKFNIPQGRKVYTIYLMGQSETKGLSYSQTFQKDMSFNGRFSARFNLLDRSIARSGYKFSAWAIEKNGSGNIARREAKALTDFPKVMVKNPVSWRTDKNHFKVSFLVENIRDMCAAYGEGILVEVEVRVQCASIYSYFPTQDVEIISPYDGKKIIDRRVYFPKIDGPVCINIPIHENDKNDDHWWRITIYDPTGRRIVFKEGDGYSMHKANLDKYDPAP